MHSYQLPQSTNDKITHIKVIATSVSIEKPYDQWPLWAKTISLNKSDSDKGVGDTVYRTIGAPASKAFKTWFMIIFGRSCGCTNRHIRWNEEYPYKFNTCE